jgi:hypothetical protein
MIDHFACYLVSNISQSQHFNRVLASSNWRYVRVPEIDMSDHLSGCRSVVLMSRWDVTVKAMKSNSELLLYHLLTASAM